MSKSKTIAEQIDLLQSENEHLKELNKLFEKAIKLEFDMEAKKIHKIIENWNDFNEYWNQICRYFGLKKHLIWQNLSRLCAPSKALISTKFMLQMKEWMLVQRG